MSPVIGVVDAYKRLSSHLVTDFTYYPPEVLMIAEYQRVKAHQLTPAQLARNTRVSQVLCYSDVYSDVIFNFEGLA